MTEAEMAWPGGDAYRREVINEDGTIQSLIAPRNNIADGPPLLSGPHQPEAAVNCRQGKATAHMASDRTPTLARRRLG